MPFQLALPAPSFGYQPQTPQPQSPVQGWIGPYYTFDGSHVWHRSGSYSLKQYARLDGAKGKGGLEDNWAFVPFAPGVSYWMQRDIMGWSGPPPNQTGPTTVTSVGPWTVSCTAKTGWNPSSLPIARVWSCPRGVPYPPVPPASVPWGQVGQGFGLAQSYNFGVQPVAATPIGPWTGPFVVPGYEAYSSDLYSGAVYWMLKGDSAHWYRPQGFSFTVGNPQKPTGPAWWIRSPVGYGYPSEIMCSAMPGAQVWNCLAGDGHYPPVPPPPLKRIYNWA